MAGTDPRFPSAQFREGILFAMTMAKPNTVSEQVTFYRVNDPVYNTGKNPAGKPYALNAAPVINASRDEVIVDCAVEYVARTSRSDVTSVGEFNLSRVEILVFKEGLEEIQDIDATHVSVGENNYEISHIGPPIALFDVEFHVCHAQAIDES